MSIARAEKLKVDLTDKWVIVDANIPELRRFVGLSGKVKTVNMNCRALVEFDGPADIGWYDIDTTFLRVVDAPLPKAAPAEKAEKPAAEKPAATKPAAGKSPLEMARAQGAQKPGGGGPSPLELARAQAAKKEGGEPAAAPAKKLSPLELARQQGAVKAGGGAPAAAAPAEAPAAAPASAESAPAPAAEKKAPPVGADGKKLSPLELARMQGAVKPK